jgi:hypothetical protein
LNGPARRARQARRRRVRSRPGRARRPPRGCVPADGLGHRCPRDVASGPVVVSGACRQRTRCGPCACVHDCESPCGRLSDLSTGRWSGRDRLSRFGNTPRGGAGWGLASVTASIGFFVV